MRMLRTKSALVVVMCGVLWSVACDHAQLLAPTASTITVSAGTRTLGLGGTTEVTAFVIEQAGTPVQNGTTVRFSTSLGSVNPVEAQTRNGLAITTFFAGNISGVADVTAVSGGAGGTSSSNGTGSPATSTNVVQITIGAANASRVAVTASPGSVSSNGGSSQITATVLDSSGNALSGVPVFFSSTAGTLSSSSATSDSNGRASVTLNTNREAEVSVRVGSGADARTATITVRVNVQGTVTLTCQGSGTAAASSCSQIAGQAVTFTASRGTTTGAASISSSRLDFGDGSSASLGSLASPTTVNHTYSNNGTYTATLTATDANGETSSTSVTVTISARPPLGVSLAATPGTSQPGVGNTTSFTATVTPPTGGADMVESYTWDFGDGSTATTSGNTTTHVYRSNGAKTATVTVRTTDGRTATGRAEFIISGI